MPHDAGILHLPQPVDHALSLARLDVGVVQLDDIDAVGLEPLEALADAAVQVLTREDVRGLIGVGVLVDRRQLS